MNPMAPLDLPMASYRPTGLDDPILMKEQNIEKSSLCRRIGRISNNST